MRAVVEVIEVLKTVPPDHFAFATVLAVLALSAFVVHKMAAVTGGGRRREK